MQYITLDTNTDFDGWRKAARSLVLHHVQPTDVTWTVQGGEADLFAPPSPSPILEVNDGISMEHYARHSTVNKQRTVEVYEAIVAATFR